MIKNSPKITFVIANYNSYKFINLLCASIYKFTKEPYRIIIVDNSDNSEENLIEKDRNIFYFHRTTGDRLGSKGHAAALQYGLEKATSELVCFLDADTCFLDLWTDCVLDILSSNIFVSGRYEPQLSIARPQFMIFRRNYFLGNKLKINASFVDTCGNITNYCNVRGLPYHILENSYNNPDLSTKRMFPHLKGEEAFCNNKPFFIHQGRGSLQGDRSSWETELWTFLSRI